MWILPMRCVLVRVAVSRNQLWQNLNGAPAGAQQQQGKTTKTVYPGGPGVYAREIQSWWHFVAGLQKGEYGDMIAE